MREYHYQRRQAIIAWMGGKCVKCDATDNLQFDHIDPSLKSFDVNRVHLLTLDNPVAVAELMKCQLLCEPHHREKTAAENSVGHGEGLTGKKNCRCDLCRPLKNAWMREYRKTHPRRRVSESNRSDVRLRTAAVP
jgi:hypothetical protein